VAVDDSVDVTVLVTVVVTVVIAHSVKLPSIKLLMASFITNAVSSHPVNDPFKYPSIVHCTLS
jgi:hypothetical protein